MSRILPRKFQGACLWLVSLNNNQTRAPSREGGENRGRIETLTAGDWAYHAPWLLVIKYTRDFRFSFQLDKYQDIRKGGDFHRVVLTVKLEFDKQVTSSAKHFLTILLPIADRARWHNDGTRFLRKEVTFR